MQIQVKRIELGKFPKVWYEDNRYMGCPKEMAETFVQGEYYDVTIEEKKIKLKDGNSFTAKNILSATGFKKPVASSIAPLLEQRTAPISQVQREESIKQNMELKNKAIELASNLKAKSVALEAACMMVKAYAEACSASGAFTGLKENECRDWLQSLKKVEFDDNLNLLGLEKEAQL